MHSGIQKPPMTFRAKPVVKRDKPSWQRSDRRNFYTNIGFGLVVVVAVLILIIAAVLTWYDQHLAPVASVNGQTITKDDFVRRFGAESARFQIALRRLDDEFNAGRLTQAQLDSQKQLVQQRAQQLQAIVYERLIDGKVMEALAAQEGVTITPEEIQAQIDKEATLPEQRHAWVIEVEPEVDEGADEPTAEQKAAAKAKADQALADINGGKTWDEVAKAVSTGSTKATGGDLNYIGGEDTSRDPAWLEAVFALENNAMTGVIEGEDGVFRIGRVTDIVPERIVTAYRDEVVAEGVDAAYYESVVRMDLLSEKLNEEVTARALAAAPQRETREIFIQSGDTEALPTGSVKTRHILFSPKDDSENASTVPATDPSWATAEQDARAAYAKIKADPELFDETAREESDEPGADTSGGKLPYFDPSMTIANGGGLDDAFGAAIFKAGLKPGDVLEPIKSAFGWHVIQIMYFPPDIDQANKLKADLADGADFGELARDYSNGAESGEGGNLGWVARYQYPKEREDAIFAAPIGEVSDPIVVEDEGIYLFLVTEEETRAPDGEQREAIEAEAFANWYAQKRLEFNITRDVDLAATGG
jgi:parvulin-like peptidyl-prolyl isomerase